jgi:MscS family membrane protein
VLSPRVYFNDYNAESLNLFLIYWYAPPAWWDYMDHAHRLNLRIFEEFEKAGIEFAFPTQTLYLAGDPKRELAVRMLGEQQ